MDFTRDVFLLKLQSSQSKLMPTHFTASVCAWRCVALRWKCIMGKYMKLMPNENSLLSNPNNSFDWVTHSLRKSNWGFLTSTSIKTKEKRNSEKERCVNNLDLCDRITGFIYGCLFCLQFPLANAECQRLNLFMPINQKHMHAHPRFIIQFKPTKWHPFHFQDTLSSHAYVCTHLQKDYANLASIHSSFSGVFAYFVVAVIHHSHTMKSFACLVFKQIHFNTF